MQCVNEWQQRRRWQQYSNHDHIVHRKISQYNPKTKNQSAACMRFFPFGRFITWLFVPLDMPVPNHISFDSIVLHKSID